MAKWLKTTLILLGILLAVAVVFIGLVHVWWNGGFNASSPREIATYTSPDGEYTLIFEQLGAARWPFGPADIRLTLKTGKGVYIDQINAKVYNDGGNAYPRNIMSIQWGEDTVTVILDRGEQRDQGYIFFLSKKVPSKIPS